MARPGTRRYSVDLLHAMRQYAPEIKSIKDGKAVLDKTTVDMLERFTRMSAKQKDTRSKNTYKKATQNYTKLIKKNKGNPGVVKKLRGAQKLSQIKSIFGKGAVTDEQYKKANEFLSGIGISDKDIAQYWGY